MWRALDVKLEQARALASNATAGLGDRMVEERADLCKVLGSIALWGQEPG